MKLRVLLLSTILLNLSSVIIHGYSQDVKWKGTIEEENGVKVIKNPNEPLYGEITFNLEEDLSLGDVNDDNYYFPRGASLAVDDLGNLYVLDRGNSRVQKYNPSGHYILTIGRKGQGPGEFQLPYHIAFGADGNLWILDSPARKLNAFSPDGTFIKNVIYKSFILPDFFISQEGYIYGLKEKHDAQSDSRIAVLQLSSDGSLKSTIAEFQSELKPNQSWFTIHFYTNHLFLCPLSASSFCYGFSSAYKLYCADGYGRTTLIIEKDEKPIPVSREEKRGTLRDGKGIKMEFGYSRPVKIEDGVVFPPFRPFIKRIFSDDVGRIYVVRFYSILEDNNNKTLDIFSKDGRYLYRTRLPFLPEFIKAGFLYEIRKDEETDDIKIIRHLIKNWDQIKK